MSGSVPLQAMSIPGQGHRLPQPWLEGSRGREHPWTAGPWGGSARPQNSPAHPSHLKMHLGAFPVAMSFWDPPKRELYRQGKFGERFEVSQCHFTASVIIREPLLLILTCLPLLCLCVASLSRPLRPRPHPSQPCTPGYEPTPLLPSPPLVLSLLHMPESSTLFFYPAWLLGDPVCYSPTPSCGADRWGCLSGRPQEST